MVDVILLISNRKIVEKWPIVHQKYLEIIMWHYNYHGQCYGPVTKEEIIVKIRNQVITSNTNVWHDGMISWSEANNIPELQEIFSEESGSAGFSNRLKTTRKSFSLWYEGICLKYKLFKNRILFYITHQSSQSLLIALCTVMVIFWPEIATIPLAILSIILGIKGLYTPYKKLAITGIFVSILSLLYVIYY